MADTLHKLARYQNGNLLSFAPLKARKKVIRDIREKAKQTSMGIIYTVWIVDFNGNKLRQLFSVTG